MFLFRKLYPKIKDHLKQKQISVLTGMRRTGKTTIIKELLREVDSDNKLYIDLERLDNRELFSQSNYDNIMRDLENSGIDIKKKIFLAFDEIQLLPKIASVLKYFYDNYNIKIIATGSSSYYLKDLFSESLAGRKKIFELFPLDFGEYLGFKNVSWKKELKWQDKKFNKTAYEALRHYYEEYIEYGGFPEVALAESTDQKKDILFDIISSYINIDIKSLLDFRKEHDIYNLLKLLSVRVATRLDYSKLSRSCGFSRPTVLNYLDLFEKTYLIKRVPVFTKSPEREIVKAKKLYFLDNGLAGILSDLNSGAKFENAVFNQLYAQGDIQYYALKNGREIDFIFNKKEAFEIKEKPILGEQSDLSLLSKKAGVKKSRLIGRYSSPNYNDYIWGGEIF